MAELAKDETAVSLNDVLDNNTIAMIGLKDKDSGHPNDADHVSVPLTKAQFVTVFISLSLAVFLVALDTTIVSTAQPAIGQEFQALHQIAWIGTGFFLTSTAFSPTYGSMCDILG
jgi:hypothetical protein